MNSTLYFTIGEDHVDLQLWATDGSPAGTIPLTYISVCDPYLENNPFGPVAVNGLLLFYAKNDQGQCVVWKSNGTVAGTAPARLNWPAGEDLNPRVTPTPVNGALYFVFGGDLWKSDGTGAGTVLVKHFAAFEPGSQPDNLTDVNGTLFYSAWDPMLSWAAGFGKAMAPRLALCGSKISARAIMVIGLLNPPGRS